MILKLIESKKFFKRKVCLKYSPVFFRVLMKQRTYHPYFSQKKNAIGKLSKFTAFENGQQNYYYVSSNG